MFAAVKLKAPLDYWMSGRQKNVIGRFLISSNISKELLKIGETYYHYSKVIKALMNECLLYQIFNTLSYVLMDAVLSTVFPLVLLCLLLLLSKAIP